jgi:hypothetical protein
MMEPTACNALSNYGHRPPIWFDSHVDSSVGRARAKKSPLLLLQLPHPPMAPSARSSAMQLSMPVALSSTCFSNTASKELTAWHSWLPPTRPCWCFSVRSPRRIKNFNRFSLLRLILSHQSGQMCCTPRRRSRTPEATSHYQVCP